MIDEGAQQRDLENIKRTLRELPPSVAASFAPLVADLQQTIYDLLASQYWTQTETASHIASPGDIAPGNVTASGNVSAGGQVISAGIVNSPGTKANTVTVAYSAVYIDGDGNMGGNTSSRRFKTNISEVEYDLDGILALKQYKYQRHTDVLEMGEAAPWQQGMIAEEVEPVAPAHVWLDEGGLVEGIRYEELTGPLIAALRRERTERLAFEAKVRAFLGPDFV